MDLNRLAEKSQEAVSEAQNKAVTLGHIEVDPEQLLAVLLDQQDGLLPRVLQKMDVPAETIKQAVEAEPQRRPRVSGPGIERGKIYLSQRLSELLVAAEKELAG